MARWGVFTEACNEVLKDRLGFNPSSGSGFVFLFVFIYLFFFQNHTVCSAGFPGAPDLVHVEML